MTRTTQPYRKGPRMPGSALQAALRGRTLTGTNPMDVRRNAMRVAKGQGARKPKLLRALQQQSAVRRSTLRR